MGKPFFDLPYARGVQRMSEQELDRGLDWVDDRFHLIRRALRTGPPAGCLPLPLLLTRANAALAGTRTRRCLPSTGCSTLRALRCTATAFAAWWWTPTTSWTTSALPA